MATTEEIITSGGHPSHVDPGAEKVYGSQNEDHISASVEEIAEGIKIQGKETPLSPHAGSAKAETKRKAEPQDSGPLRRSRELLERVAWYPLRIAAVGLGAASLAATIVKTSWNGMIHRRIV